MQKFLKDLKDLPFALRVALWVIGLMLACACIVVIVWQLPEEVQIYLAAPIGLLIGWVYSKLASSALGVFE